MAGILHLPQGGAQIIVVDEIPEVVVPGEDTPIEDQLATLGTYTQIIATDGTYKTAAAIWDDYLEWEKQAQNGDNCIFNQTKHNGLNFQPQSTSNPYSVEAMYMDRILNFASKRVICFVMLSEASWTTTRLHVYFLPYNTTNTVASDISKLHTYLNGGDQSDIIDTNFLHSGYGDANDEQGIILTELPSAGKYKIALSAVPSQTNACPTIYKLNFRTY